MCDYSLMSLPNRLAVCGEELVAHKFKYGCMGLVSELDGRPAKEIEPAKHGFFKKLKQTLFPAVSRQCTVVCIPPGAELMVHDIPYQLQVALGLESGTQRVVFTQIGTTGFRDAIRFHNGFEVLLQNLKEGQRIRILALSREERDHDSVLQSEAVSGGF